jgi:hypothetical protein
LRPFGKATSCDFAERGDLPQTGYAKPPEPGSWERLIWTRSRTSTLGRLRRDLTILERELHFCGNDDGVIERQSRHAPYKYRFLEKKVERKSISSTGERHGSCITIHSDILTSMKPLSCDTCAKNSRNTILAGYNRTMAEWTAHISNYPRGQS